MVRPASTRRDWIQPVVAVAPLSRLSTFDRALALPSFPQHSRHPQPINHPSTHLLTVACDCAGSLINASDPAGCNFTMTHDGFRLQVRHLHAPIAPPPPAALAPLPVAVGGAANRSQLAWACRLPDRSPPPPTAPPRRPPPQSTHASSRWPGLAGPNTPDHTAEPHRRAQPGPTAASDPQALWAPLCPPPLPPAHTHRLPPLTVAAATCAPLVQVGCLECSALPRGRGAAEQRASAAASRHRVHHGPGPPPSCSSTPRCSALPPHLASERPQLRPVIASTL